jgi:CHAT domain-containing protein
VRVRNLGDIGRRLSARLLDPIAPQLAAARAWTISPDGPIAFLPFESLLFAGREVNETRSVSYAASLASIAAMPARVTTGARSDFLGVGINRFAGDSARWVELPRAEREVEAIAALFPVSRTLLGAQATESSLRQLADSGELRRFRLVHFATHAYLSQRGATVSGIVLADTKPGTSEGIITAAEWPTYRVQSDLVVLSACDTGLGNLVAGEGVVGLPTAILAAGSRAVILTLWSVADESAADFMPRFYKRLKAGKSPAEALRETKLEFARSKGPWSSPRHWAPYVLYGAS